MRLSLRWLAGALLLLFAVDAAAAYIVNGERKSFEIYRTANPPVIDGKLDDVAWENAATAAISRLVPMLATSPRPR